MPEIANDKSNAQVLILQLAHQAGFQDEYAARYLRFHGASILRMRVILHSRGWRCASSCNRNSVSEITLQRRMEKKFVSKLLKRPQSPDDWRRLARRLIRMHMTMLGWRYSDLARALVEMGVREEELLLKNRIGLGRFRATLFLQCLMAMGVDELRLPSIHDMAAPGQDGTDGDERPSSG